MRYRVLWVDTGTEGLADGAALRVGDLDAQQPLEAVVVGFGRPVLVDCDGPVVGEDGSSSERGDGAAGGVWAAALCPRGAAAYFEAEVVQRPDGGALLLGVAGGHCVSADGGDRQGAHGSGSGCATALLLPGPARMNGASEDCPAALETAAAASNAGWQEGQTVGVAVDLRAGRATVRVSADGNWASAPAVPLELPAGVNGVRPAAFFGGGGRAAVRMNLGVHRFLHGPPDAEHAPFSTMLWTVLRTRDYDAH